MMNPKEFGWTEYQQVTVTNPTSEDFRFKVHGKDYMLAAGRTAKMPGFIAWLYVYGQSVKMAQADGAWPRWNEEGFRKTYFDKFMVGVDELISTGEEEPEPEVRTFGEEPETEEEPKAKRGRPARAQ
jgi:hypothetical protein